MTSYLEQGYLAVLAGAFKELLKKYGSPENIPKEEYDKAFKKEDVERFCHTERVMNERLEKMQDATVKYTKDGAIDFKSIPQEVLWRLAGWDK